MIEVIDNHSVRIDLLQKGPVLDAGCRSFRFAQWFYARGHQVVALDPSPEILEMASIDGDSKNSFQFFRRGLVANEQSTYRLVMTDDPEARYLSHDKGESVKTAEVDALGFDHWDVVKLNIEGSEYEILANWLGPIANQLVVSFHEHTPQGQGEAKIAEIIKHLSQWYEVFNHKKEKRYGCSENYWDSQFILKELL